MKDWGAEVTVTFEQGDSSWGTTATCRGCRVGYLWCELESGCLELSDFYVADEAEVPWRQLNTIRCILRIRPHRVNFRGLGIGARLMDRVLAEADAHGVREIWGSVTPDDIKKTPHLLDWYGRLGFEVIEPNHECLPSAAKMIRRFRR